MNENNLYRPPEANLEIAPKAIENHLREPRKCPASAGWYWITDAWQLFKKRPGFWIGMWVTFTLVLIVLSVLPVISLATPFITPFFFAGFAFAAIKMDNDEIATFSDLLIGFNKEGCSRSLLGASAIYFSCSAVMLIFLFMFIFGLSSLTANPILIVVPVLIYLAVQIPLVMSIWFMPILIVQHGQGAWQAMKLSFSGCWRNMIPFFIYGLILILFFILALIPLFLGLLIVGPLSTLTIYTAYKDIYLHTGHYEFSA